MSSKNKLQELLQKLSLDLPEYEVENIAGLAHSRSHKCSVSVKWKDGHLLMEEGEARKKKDAEQNAARKMLQRISAESGVEHYGPAAEESPNNVYEGPSHDMKSQLQILLQKHGFRLPKYHCLPPKGPPHQPTFTVKLEILSAKGELVWVGNGHGNSKKCAEVHAAHQGLQFMQSTDFRPSAKVAQSHSPPPEWIEPSTEVEIAEHLAKFKIRQVTERGESEGVWLCMALASGGGVDYPVASHGQGSSPAAAEREAFLHLIHNIHHLFPTINIQ